MAIVVQYLPANALEIIMVSFLFVSLSSAFVSNAVKCKSKEAYLKIVSITLSLTVTIESLVISPWEHLVTLSRIAGYAAQKCLIIMHFFNAAMYLFICYTFLHRRKIRAYL